MIKSSIVLLLFTCTPLAAKTFYVTPGGNDGQDGLTSKTAWRSVSKVNSAKLLPGDEVLFERGGVWFEAFQPTSSGEAGKPITFTSYGEGAAPVFDGSDEVPSASPVPAAGDVHAVLASGEFLRQGPDWKLEKGGITFTHKLPAGAKLRIIRRHNIVNLQGLRHIVIRGLAVNATARMHAGYGFRVEMSEDITLEDCIATRCGKHHYGIINSTRIVVRRCHASLEMPDQGPGGASAFVSYSDKRRKGDISRYEDCTVENYRDASERGQYPAFVTHGEGIGEIVITGLTSKGAGLTFNNLESGAKLSLLSSTIEDGDLGLYGRGSLVEKVTLTRGILTLAGDNNQVKECTLSGLNPGFKGYQAAVVNSGQGNLIKDCMITLDASAKSFNAAIALVNPKSQFTWSGCQITTPSCAVKTQFPDVKGAGCTAARNQYQTNATFIIRGVEKPLSLQQWQELDLDAQ